MKTTYEKLVSCEGLHAHASTKCTMNGVKLWLFKHAASICSKAIIGRQIWD
jgi:hypothetical protein